MDTGLAERVVLVTGGSSGIGAAVAEAYGREGARVALTYRKEEQAAAAVADRIRLAGAAALTVPMELEDLDSVTAAVATVEATWGRVDVLVANAVRWGGTAPDPTVRFEDVPVEEWRAMLGANVVGAVAAVRAVLPGMRTRGWGRIVLISSGVAEEGRPGPGPYGTAKSALHGLARALAWEGGRDGVLTNVVAPGLTPTADRRPPAALTDRLAASVPSRRLSGPDEVARLVVFLGSGANGNVTGELVRDGSSTARAPYVGG
ncbi:SDR family oxidoreductase [Micromonospora sp. NPDC049101]|uniref:SDR family NAD(P)-dependent oxidoreductase n=1 Tax=unclassified Micromonospora TaxID=2617518 RepID=UPI0033F8FF3E